MSGDSVAAQFPYDGLGRRELSNASLPGTIQDFEYDGSSVIGWNSSGTSPYYNFLTTPGGAAPGRIVYIGRNHDQMGAPDRSVGLDDRAGERGECAGLEPAASK